MDKIVQRGYVKWTDEDGVFHKEPLADHPDMLATASPREQLHAEEARRLNAAAEKTEDQNEKSSEDVTKETLDTLKAAPEDVLTATQLNDAKPASAAEEPVQAPAAEVKEAKKAQSTEPLPTTQTT